MTPPPTTPKRIEPLELLDGEQAVMTHGTYAQVITEVEKKMIKKINEIIDTLHTIEEEQNEK